jgi:hypothetical protein
MKWFTKYKIVEITNTFYAVVRRKFLCKWEVVDTYTNKYQAECALHRIKKDS